MSFNPAAKTFIFQTVREHQVVVFVNNEFPEEDLKDVLQADVFENVDVCVLNIDQCFSQLDDSLAIRSELNRITKRPAFPHVWANGTYLGGYKQTKRAVTEGHMEFYLKV
jgi:glutaredoxin-related protein